jgi:magnesium chelatase family protein
MTCVKVRSGGLWGIEGYPVEVEVDISPGIPSFSIVGLPDTAIKESRDRIRSAIKNLGLSFPQKRITVNLSPSDVKKQGTLYDLPIAVGILTLSGQLPREKVSEFIFLGELSLNGSLRKVRGVLPIVASLKEGNFILPLENSLEGAVVPGPEVYGFAHLKEVVEFLTGDLKAEPVKTRADRILSERPDLDIDLGDVAGQVLLKKALEVSAAGGHNLYMIGTPGSGKSMIAKRMITILPPMTFEESLEVSRIYSTAGLLEDTLIRTRPFRSPHHTVSDVALIGGGSVPLPGEVSLAHRGVLFLDELPEFSRKALEALRQPLEDGYVSISRAQGRVRFPARFTLLATGNPCPCGNLGDPNRQCTCTQNQIKAYRSRVSAPVRDRIDLKVWVNPVRTEDLIKGGKGETSREVYERVLRAYMIQRDRFRDSETDFNGRMTNKEVERFCIKMMSKEAKKLVESALRNLNLTARSYYKVLKVARTVADLEESETIEDHHIAQALQLRSEDTL